MTKLFLLSTVILAFIATFYGCKTTGPKSDDYKTPYEHTGRYINFGNGGGFAGRENAYTLMDDGQMFRGANKEGIVTVLSRLDQNLATQMFNNYDNLGFGAMEINTPGNLYHFLEMVDGDNTHRLVWGGKSEKSEALEIYYKTLINLTKIEDKKATSTK